MVGSYPKRRPLRVLEKWWSRGEGLIDRLGTSSLNPMYRLGTLTIFLLLVLAVTGTYLTIFYRPGADRAYQTVAGISASWLGSLMRSTHRYASDALILVILLHAIKMLISDRFWGSRWLAWVSGWGLLALIWIIGVMGYWLVWDQQAQWMTEYGIELLKGPAALAFLLPGQTSQTFAFFVIVLFLHVFLSILIALGVIVHVLRLSRARYWAPRRIMALAAIGLVLLAIWRPVSSGAPADLSRLIGTVRIDGWYLGFLPLVTRWGSLPVWGFSLLILGVAAGLPWLWRGQSAGPAVVKDQKCTGCALCFQQCPYDAIEMHPHASSTRFDQMAQINTDLCTGCGLCVGTCSTAGMELAGLPTGQVRQQLRDSLSGARTAGVSPVVVFTCQRHLALETLPVKEHTGAEELWDRPTPSPVQAPVLATASWAGGNPYTKETPVLTCPLPCIGMVQTEWVKESLDGGAEAVVVLSCPSDDCSFREGANWLSQRLSRFRSLIKRGVYWVETAPGDRHIITQALDDLHANNGTEELAGDGRWHVQPPNEGRPSTLPLQGATVRSLAVGLAVLVLTFGISLLAERPVAATSTDKGTLRLALVHQGNFKAASTDLSSEVTGKLPDGVSPQQVLGGERYPVALRVEINGQQMMKRRYEPGGLRHEAEVYVLESWPQPPGRYDVDISMMDDGSNWRTVFSGTVTVEAGHVRTLTYEPDADTFVLR